MARLSAACTLIIALVVIECHRSQAFTTTFTNGASGAVCRNSPQCLDDTQARCVRGRCRCRRPAKWGLGHFLCHKRNEVFCGIFNDPLILGYDGSKAFAPLSCKFKLTHLMTPICDTSDPKNVTTFPDDGTCDIRVMAWGGRRKGKTFMRAVEVRFMVIYQDTVYHHLTTITASAAGGTYTFTESTNQDMFGPPTTGPALNTTIPGLGRIFTKHDFVNNFAVIVAEMCGTKIGIRGVDQVLNPLDTTAGIFIKVNTDCDVTYVNPGTSLCSPPKGQGASLADHVANLEQLTGKTVTPAIAALHKVLTAATPQNFPDAPAVMQQLLDTASACSASRVIDAIKACVFIMEDIKFFKCYDKTDNMEDAIALMNMCMFSVCENNVVTCTEVKEEIGDPPNCAISATDTIVDMECDSMAQIAP